MDAENNVYKVNLIEKLLVTVLAKVANVIPEVEWPFYAPLIHEILKLKKESK
jgi:hypothetical protein